MEVGIVIFLCKIEIQGQFIFKFFWFKYSFLLKTAFLILEDKKGKNTTRTHLVPAPQGKNEENSTRGL